MDEETSDRVIEQRLRNRIIEAIEILSLGNRGLIEVNYNEFFEGFYDYWRDGQMVWRPNSAMTEEEERSVDALGRMLDNVTMETRHFRSEVEYLQSGCAERIKPLARDSLKIFLSRGRFREDCEELSPTASTSQT